MVKSVVFVENHFVFPNKNMTAVNTPLHQSIKLVFGKAKKRKKKKTRKKYKNMTDEIKMANMFGFELQNWDHFLNSRAKGHLIVSTTKNTFLYFCILNHP